MEELDKALAEVTTGLVDLSRQVGPEVGEAVLMAAQIHGIVQLGIGFVCAILGALTGVAAIRMFRKISTCELGHEEGWVIAGAFTTSGAVALLLIAGRNIFHAGNWISAFNPVAGLAWRVVEKL